MSNIKKKAKKMKSNNVSLNKSIEKQWEVEEVEPIINGKSEHLEKDEVTADDRLSNQDCKATDMAPTKRKKRGIIYLSSLPKYMNVTTVREIFSEYGTVKRIFLQPAAVDGNLYIEY